jgi:hypothetical protein
LIAGLANAQERPKALAYEVVRLRDYAKRLSKVPELKRVHLTLSAELELQLGRWESEASRQAEQDRNTIYDILGKTDPNLSALTISPRQKKAFELYANAHVIDALSLDFRHNLMTCIHSLLAFGNIVISAYSAEAWMTWALALAACPNLACALSSRVRAR